MAKSSSIMRETGDLSELKLDLWQDYIFHYSSVQDHLFFLQNILFYGKMGAFFYFKLQIYVKKSRCPVFQLWSCENKWHVIRKSVRRNVSRLHFDQMYAPVLL